MREALTIISAGLFGLLFGLGLVTSQMVDPEVVADFLDITGDWNPQLAFVMAGGIAVAGPAFFFARRGRHALLGQAFALPNRSRIDRELLLGAGVFGVGWGLAGICPGPGITLLGTFDTGAFYFVPAVIAGMFIARLRRPRMATST